ncbi:MAG: AraC family transcriptional regulator [Halieaceae bacterium]|jgi:AraC-like DNA-binding protein|nr:AraC family transcriptional regulator [Halieaceae bacterium]
MTAAVQDERVPTRYLVSLLRLVPRAQRDALRERTGLGFDPEDSGHPHWRPEVSAMQYSRLYQRVLGTIADESFGLQPGQEVAPGAFRMMCYCVMSCDNLGRAIQRASEFYRTLYPEQKSLYTNFSEASARVGYREALAPGESRVDVLDAYALSAWHRFFGWLTGRPLALQRVDFVGEAPDRPDKYQALFACPVYFRQPANLMYFDSSYLRLPVVHTEQSVDEFLRTAPYQLLTMTRERYDRSLVTRVRAMIGHDFSEGFPSFDSISRALNMSAPTLRRRLKREGTTFQQLKDDCRREAACAYLKQPDLPVSAIAIHLGFTDPSAFHRSFKKWLGVTPGAYRAQAMAEAAAPGV